MSRLGNRIKELREEKGYSQKQLGELLGVHPSKVSHLETGFHNLSIPMAAQLASILDVSQDELVKLELERVSGLPALKAAQ